MKFKRVNTYQALREQSSRRKAFGKSGALTRRRGGAQSISAARRLNSREQVVRLPLSCRWRLSSLSKLPASLSAEGS